MKELQIEIDEAKYSEEFHQMYKEAAFAARIQQISENFKRIFVDTNNMIGFRALKLKKALYDPCFQQDIEKNIKIIQQKANQIISIANKKFQILVQNNFDVTAVFDGNPLGIKGKFKNVSIPKKYQKSKYKKENFIRLLNKIQTQIILFLKKYKVKVKFAPNESDYLILRSFELNQCDIVLSQDHLFIQHKKPVLVLLTTQGSCRYVDLEFCNPKQIKNSNLKLLIALVQDPFKRAMYQAIKGPKHIKRLPYSQQISFSTGQILSFVHQANSLSELFDLVQKRFSWAKVQFNQQYRQTAQCLRLLDLLGTCIDSQSGKISYINPQLVNRQFEAVGMTELKWKELMGNITEDFEEKLYREITQQSMHTKQPLRPFMTNIEKARKMQEQLRNTKIWVTLYTESPS